MAKRQPENARNKAFDERNIAGIALIPSQTRLPKDKLLWERRITTPQGVDLTVTVEGNASVGLPHGLDNDILVAIVNAYVEDGCPADRTITTSAYRLLSAPGLSTSKYYYDALHLGLRRLRTANYTVTNGWYDAHQKRYTDAMFSILDNVELTRAEDGIDERSVLRLTLNKWVAHSVQQGYLKPLNLTLYRRLEAVAARTVYRLLDSYLFEALERGENRPTHLTVQVLPWAVNCGLLMETPDKVRRALDPIHEDLIKHGFLSSVRYIGRGKTQEVEYAFGSASALAEPEHVEALRRYGVHATVAMKYARELGADVLKVVAQFEEHKRTSRSPIENEARYLVSMLKQAADHVATFNARPTKAEKAASPSSRPPKTDERQERLFDLRSREDEHKAFDALTPEVAYERLLARMQLFRLAPLLSTGDLDRLRSALVAGRVRASAVYEAVLKGALPGADKAEVARLLRSLVP